MTDRVAQLQALLDAAGLPALLVTDLASVRWLTGFTGSAGSVLVHRDGPPLLVTDNRYLQRAAAEAPDVPTIADRTLGWLVDSYRPGKPLAVEADVMPWAVVRQIDDLLEGSELIPTSGLVRQLRSIKGDEELSALRMACDLTVKAFDAACGWLEPGMTERAVARRLIDQVLDLGADGSAFAPIVASGPNGAVPHHDPGERALQVGDLVTMDFGAQVEGYHADMTRTVALGEPDMSMRRIHNLVQAAQQAGVEACRPGVETAHVDRQCRELIAAAGHGENFLHGTGHGVGLQIHEDPFLGASTVGTLQERMAITVEPGVYLPGLGGVRIEDVVLVASAGPERLTPAPHELLIL